MKKLLRWLGYGLAAIFVLLIVGAAYVWLACRLAYAGFYLAGLGALRSLIWLGATGASVMVAIA